ncbi:MAG: N-formylglutamate amidohydrolase [Rhodospirillaceae bacterium]|nr:N-formylglutamate amidohydrolase [Rhodospirillaceae bacterium]
MSEAGARDMPTLRVDMPDPQTMPVVFASPHSGSAYPRELLEGSRLDRMALRRSEDSFVDELFADAPRHGAPLIAALFPRAFIDPNREPYELDPAMFAHDLPAYVNISSPRVAAGLGTVPRVVSSGEEIYGRKLSFAEVEERLDRFYRPYHAALRRLVAETRQRFALCLLIDCHSMPSAGWPGEPETGRDMPDVVLGDCHGTSCDGWISARVEQMLRQLGFRVSRNAPYSGGFVTQHYGRPSEQVHALQIEINRALYMDESRLVRSAGFDPLREKMARLIASLGRLLAAGASPAKAAE